MAPAEWMGGCSNSKTPSLGKLHVMVSLRGCVPPPPNTQGTNPLAWLPSSDPG